MSKSYLHKNLLRALVEKGKIKTTQRRAQATRSLVDRVVNKAKKGSVKDNFLVSLLSKKLVEKLVNEIIPSFKNRKSGFTTIVKIGRRKGDNAPMVALEWVEEHDDVHKTNKSK